MPEGFTKCVSSGGSIRTKSLGGRKYVHICYKDGKSFRGHVKTRKKTMATK